VPREGGPRLNSLRARLLLPIAGIVVVSVALTLLLSALLTRNAAEAAAERELSRQASVHAAQQQASLCPLCERDIKRLRSQLGPRYQVIVLPLAKPSPYLRPDELRALRAGRDVSFQRVVNGEDSFVAGRRVTARGKPFGFLVARSAKLQDFGPFVDALLVAGIAGLFLAVAAALLLARLIAARIEHVSSAIRAFADRDEPTRLAVRGPNELASLAASFNHMADELDRAREAERAFLLSVSHELKTPLTSIRGYAEALAEDAVDVGEAAATLRAEAGRLERLVHDLLDLARMNRSRFDVRKEPIDVGEAALEAVRRYERLAGTLGVALEAQMDNPAMAVGDADRIHQVIGNLVENALRVTPAGAGVRVCVDGTTVRVEDDGPGLQADELPRAFERFYLHSRYGKDRKVGTGLGLAIVKQLTDAMGGKVSVRSLPGGGSSFSVSLPPLVDAERGLRPAYERRTPG
jgi:two-component system sensor histidine kinase BaeS